MGVMTAAPRWGNIKEHRFLLFIDLGRSVVHPAGWPAARADLVDAGRSMRELSLSGERSASAAPPKTPVRLYARRGACARISATGLLAAPTAGSTSCSPKVCRRGGI